MKTLTTLLLFLTSLVSIGQCFRVLDGNGNFNNVNPQWISCTPGNYNLILQTDIAVGPYTVNWGDGNSSSGANITPPAFIQHTYAASTSNYTITITETSTGCTITGLVVLERNPLASIQLPAGDDNFGCTPVLFRFINSSTQISGNTTFTWDFGDGSPVEVYNSTNLGDTIPHVYLPGIGVQSCDLEVTLEATNFCGTSTASFFPLKVWDLDEAQITPDNTLLCFPDNTFQYTNTTIRNCFPEGNNSQRYEYWNFGDYWGLGYDSVITWRPWNPPIINPPPISYPGVGTYTVTLIDSSFCGRDTTSINVTITNPPTAVLTADKDTICAGESVRFFNNSFGGANTYSWNFGQGAGWQNLSGSNKTRTFNTAGSYTIGLIVGVAGAVGCMDTAYVDLHVNPAPINSFTVDNNNACDSMTVNFSNTTTGANFWRWDFGNGNTFLGENPPPQFYGSPGTYTVTLFTQSFSGCTDSISQLLNVFQTPQPAFFPTTVCVNEMASFTDLTPQLGSDPILSWFWEFGNGQTSTAQNPNTIYTAGGNYNIILTVTTANCSATDTIPILVENLPTASFTSSPQNGCSRLGVNFTNTSTANTTRFLWDFGDGSPLDTTENPFHEFVNTTASDTNYIVTFIASTAFGCADTISDTITVFPIPTPDFISDAVVDCGPITVNFTNLTNGVGLTYNWNFGDGTPNSTLQNPTHVFDNKTLFISNYNVSLEVTSANGCRDTITKIVTVNPEPIFNFSANPDSGCSPLAVQFPVVVGAVSYQWDFGDGNTSSGPNPSHVFVNNTTNNRTYQVTLIAQNSFGCRDTSVSQVLVFPNPTANFTLDTNRGCQPLPIEITNSSTGANVYDWTFGDGTTSDTASAIFTKVFTNGSAASVNRNIRLITSTLQGCSDTVNRMVEVYPRVVAEVVSDTVGCSPLPVTFFNQSVGAINYQWNFGDGTSSALNAPRHVFTNTQLSDTVFNVSLVAASIQGCTDTTNQNILVYPKPVADFTIDTASGCHPLVVDFTNQSLIADSCNWSWGDGTFDNNCFSANQHPFTNTTSTLPINYSSRLIVFTNNGCRDTISRIITVNPQVVADFVTDTAGCSPLSARFNNNSIGSNDFIWSFGDGVLNNSINPRHIYQNFGQNDTVYTAQLIARSPQQCFDTTAVDITVFAKPIADFTATTIGGCQPLEVQYTNNSQLNDSCSWSYGDGSSLTNCNLITSHTYFNQTSIVPISYTTQLRVFTSNGCSDSLNQIITVDPQVMADFTFDTIGCSPFPVTFRSQSFGANSYNWDFDDGNTAQGLIANHTFTNTTATDTTFNVQLIATSVYNCSDTMINDITVRPTPIPNFTATPITQLFPSATVNLTNTSNQGPWDFRWSFGDTTFSTLQNPGSHTYGYWGNYRIWLSASTAYCADSIFQDIRIIAPVPVADFNDSSKGCEPLEVRFTNESIYANQFTWDFGDGSVSTQRNPTYTYRSPGTYAVSLTAVGYGGQDIERKQGYVVVHPRAVASFTLNKDPNEKIFIPNDPIAASNFSFNADDFLWDFGDGNTSTDRNPVHFYTTEGDFLITLIAYTDEGCNDTLDANRLVTAELQGEVRIPNAFTPSTSGGNGNGAGDVNRNPGFGEVNDVFYALVQGAQTYELNIFNKWGELLFVSKDQEIGWNGYYKGRLSQQDTYVWKVKATFLDGRTVIKTGDLLLLR
jgi:PKD repeat protein